MAKRGYVYAAVYADGQSPGFVKIGQTQNLDKRGRTLGGSGLNEISIEKSALVDDMDMVESALHTILPQAQRKGEWFNIDIQRVVPLLECLDRRRWDDLRADTMAEAGGSRGSWHEAAWQMHCQGATQAEIAGKFGVTPGAVVAVKKKMRDAGRRSEEAGRQRATAERRQSPRKQKQTSRQPGITPQSDFEDPILEVLRKLGGRGLARDVIGGVGQLMEGKLRRADYGRVGNNQVRWRNKVQWARQALKDSGRLKADSPRGWWELP